MNDILFAFQTVFPLLVYMLVGFFIKEKKWMSDSTMSQMNNLVFKIFIPMSILRNITRADMAGVNMWPIILYALLAVLLIFLLAWGFFIWFEPDKKRRSVLIQNTFRSNFVLFGLPLSQMILSGVGSGVTEVLIAFVVPWFNVLAVFILQYYGEGKMSPKKLIKGILTNPLIFASIVALIYKAVFGTLPVFLDKPVQGLAQVATPLALIILGARFEFKQSRQYRKQITVGVLLRLVIVPLMVVGGAVLLGYRGEVLVAYLALSASPVAVASYSMAQAMGADYELAGQLLLYTSLLCSLSLFIFIYVLRATALI